MEEMFGKWLRKARSKKGLTVRELARLAQVSPQYISLLETGGGRSSAGTPLRPTVEKVDALADALDADKNQARLLAGYAPFRDAIPEEIRLAIGSNKLTEEDVKLLVQFIQYRLSLRCSNDGARLLDEIMAYINGLPAMRQRDMLTIAKAFFEEADVDGQVFEGVVIKVPKEIKYTETNLARRKVSSK